MGLAPLRLPWAVPTKKTKPLYTEPPPPLPGFPVAHHSADDGFNLCSP